MKEASKLTLELKAVVDDYLTRHPFISLHALSKRCGVASSTLRRIVRLETKEDPNPTTVLGIVSAITRENRIEELVKLFDGEIKNSLDLCYARFFTQKNIPYHDDLSDLLQDRDLYIILKMASHRHGVSEKEIVDLMGLPAKPKIEELVCRELIYENKSRYYTFDENISFPAAIYKSHLPELVRFTYSKGKYVDKSIFLSVSESINKKSYDQIWTLLREASLKVAEIIKDPENAGEIPFFYNCILDTMDVSEGED